MPHVYNHQGTDVGDVTDPAVLAYYRGEQYRIEGETVAESASVAEMADLSEVAPSGHAGDGPPDQAQAAALPAAAAEQAAPEQGTDTDPAVRQRRQ